MAWTPVWGRAADPTLHARACAAVTAGSCVLHVWLAAGSHHAIWLSAVMIAMVAVCLPCTVHIWRHLRVGALQRVMVSALVMAALHAVLLLAAGPSGHGHAGPAAAGPGNPAAAATLGVIAFELTTALFAATLVARLRSRARVSSSARLIHA